MYRTLEILTDLGIISRNLFDDGIGRYHLKQTVNRHFAHHLLCVKCGQIQEVEEDLLVDVEQKVLEQFQFQVLDHRLNFPRDLQELPAKGRVEDERNTLLLR